MRGVTRHGHAEAEQLYLHLHVDIDYSDTEKKCLVDYLKCRMDRKIEPGVSCILKNDMQVFDEMR